MNRDIGGGPAFPTESFDLGGMSLRDYFAAKAMQAMLVQGIAVEWKNNDMKERIVETAYAISDAMLAARAK